MGDLISRSVLINDIRMIETDHPFDDKEDILENVLATIDYQPAVEAVPVHGEWVYWKEQCEYCMNRNTCPYPENKESMEALKQWEKENKFFGSLKLICDYYVLDKDKYYLDNPPECNAER